jgi:hypothetical protein
VASAIGGRWELLSDLLFWHQLHVYLRHPMGFCFNFDACCRHTHSCLGDVVWATPTGLYYI